MQLNPALCSFWVAMCAAWKRRSRADQGPGTTIVGLTLPSSLLIRLVVRRSPLALRSKPSLPPPNTLLVVIQRGGDVETIAKKESMDPGSRDQGGSMPFTRRGLMVEPFDRAIFSGAPPGTVIPVVVETTFGFHIIRLDRVQPAQVKSSHILIIPHLDSADLARAQLLADTVITTRRARTRYDSLLKSYHDDAEQQSQPLAPNDT